MSQRKEVRLLLFVATIVVAVTLFRLWYTIGPGRSVPAWVGAPVVEVAQASAAPYHSGDIPPNDQVLVPKPVVELVATSSNRHQETTLSAPTTSKAEPPTESAHAQPEGGCTLSDGSPGLDINTATESQFKELPGVGTVIAGAIVAEREQRGGFQSTQDLLDVKGIGPARFAKLAPLVCVSPSIPNSIPSP